ncbi:ICU11 [Symbiodinium natans]|uniref:ICU11 protein n=1 Tax=Symbiodinium natans TaxID=878477 RepID=A0A812IIE6_9DINO|nr:ICU11 [Symbiodinium natans]
MAPAPPEAAVAPSDFMAACAECEEGRPQRLRVLLASGSGLRIEGASPLAAAVALTAPAALREVLAALRPLAPSLDALDAQGHAPLHAAAELGCAGCVQALLWARADCARHTEDASYQLGQMTTVYNEGGRTALHIAACSGKEDVVEKLLEAGGPSLREQRDSFGMRACDLAEEQVALAAVAQLPRHQRVLELLGGGRDPALAAEEARRRRQGRLAELRRRVSEKQVESHHRQVCATRQAVSERYSALDAEVASGQLQNSVGEDIVAWSCQLGACAFQRMPAVTGSRISGMEEPMPGVLVFQLLGAGLCTRIWAETEHYISQAEEKSLPMPVRHDGCLDVSQIFPELLGHLTAAARPAFTQLGFQDIRLRHAFRTKNFVGREEVFARHVDKYAVTLNVCLRRTAGLQGSRVFFFGSQDATEPAYCHEHQVGLAVIHSSKEWHQTEKLFMGERGSLIMWYEMG